MRATFACLLLALIPSAAFADGAEDAAKKKLAPLQGGWKFEALEVDGERADSLEASFWWFIKGDKVLYGGSELATLVLDNETTPKCIDLNFQERKRVYEGIYAIEEDTLKICVNQVTEGAKERPADFTTKGKSGVRLLVFKRDKDRKADSIEGLGGYVGIAIKLDEDTKQVVVMDVVAGGPADKAGLKKDDILLKVGDQDATDLKTTVNLVRKTKAGSEVTLRVKRDGKEKDLTAKAAVLPFFPLE
jgi:uncharacterized protein (TIGR03067 family)